MTPIKVGLVGAGSYGRTQLKFLNMMEDFSVQAVCDVDRNAKPKVDEILSHPYRFYEDYASMLQQEGLEAVFITTPNHCHEQQVVSAIRQGLAVYLEKPPALTVKGCRTIMDEAAKTNSRVMVGMQLRYGSDYKKVKQLIDAGEIGTVKQFLYKEFRNPFMGGYDNWRVQLATSGGSIIEKNVHQFDLFDWYSDSRPVRVFGMGSNDVIYQGKDMLDRYNIMIEYQNGVQAVICESLFSPGMNDENHLYILGDKGVIIMVDGGLRIKRHQQSEFTMIPSEQQFAGMGHGGTEYNAYLSFRDYVRHGIPPYTGLAEGLNSVALALAAETSIAQKRVVELSELLSGGVE